MMPAGNILVEHQASFTGTGYPIDVSLSEDGEEMMWFISV